MILGEHGIVDSKVLDQLFAIDVKGGGKITKGVYKVIKGRVLPSIPKGEIVGILSLMAKDVAKDLAKAWGNEEE